MIKEQNIRNWALKGIAIALCGFVLVEVNYPLVQSQSRLALFGLLGLSFAFLHVHLLNRKSIGRVLRASDWLPVALTLLTFGYVLIQTEPAFSSLWFNSSTLGDRAGQEVPYDYVVGCLGLVLVLEATRRTIGLTLPLLTLVFLLYARFGTAMPDWLFPHRGYAWSRIMSQTFLHSQGVFGIALKVMFTYVFPFVIFGAFLEATGATGFIIDLSRRLFRNSPGGPAKVAVLSSGLMGSLSGSAVANTATTGTFTIPMMKSSGFKPHIAAGVEAAASSGGALMPPIMGAGAYMMLEIITPPVTYLQIIKAAIIPAVLYYLALLLVVHLHAKKIGASSDVDASTLPRLSVSQGLVFCLAILGLIVFLLLGYTPFRAVTLSLVVILGVSPWAKDTRLHGSDILDALVRTARAGIPLIAAASCVGIILGVVTLTGIGSKLPSAILPLAQNNLFAALFLLMISTIILGMGLPSAVCYLLMATFIGPLLKNLGLEPLAAHLFIFYFGMMSMVTPPVALAAFTAAAIAKADVMRSSMAAFRFALVGFLLPYAFVLNPSLLLISINGKSVVGPALISLLFVLSGILFFAVSTTGLFSQRVNGLARVALFVSACVVILTPGLTLGHVSIKSAALITGVTLLVINTLSERKLLHEKWVCDATTG
ncbi:MAG: TRAP transporter fused permease subunit [Phycisphaerae bacterium]|nr:TRAP transporter fused permease subunit [Phycisphaerae bacterium]